MRVYYVALAKQNYLSKDGTTKKGILIDGSYWAPDYDCVEESRGCPCNYGEPCNDRCTCVQPISSYGCDNCCTYGSLEQREAKAEQLKLRVQPDKPNQK